ncbi:hypothetical protein [Roseomonas chloroacetimidivorans]|jgi:hypothetical protein|uniref:hypothetical protein n=1 Tax=Roseomonas chloroacetimidivorans TaxID=1766656 RepID=UPI003C730E7C
MNNSAWAARRQDAERLLKVFRQFGPDGRAIPVSSLSVYAGFGASRTRLAAALAHLLSAGLIRQAGADPLASERAYRLAQPLGHTMPEQQKVAA